MRGRVPIGVGQGAGLVNRTLNQKIGAENRTLTLEQMPSHSHGLPMGGNAIPPFTGVVAARGQPTGTPFTLQPTGANAPHNNMQPSIGMVFMIKT